MVMRGAAGLAWIYGLSVSLFAPYAAAQPNPLDSVRLDPPRSEGKKVALCVGIREYNHDGFQSGFQNLDYATMDASDVCKTLAGYGYYALQVQEMTANRDQILQQLSAAIEQV